MQPTDIVPTDDATLRLLQEGAKSYVEAATAVITYQRTVQKKCRAVFERHFDEYAAALGITLSKGEIKDQAHPDFEKWTGEQASLGVTMSGWRCYEGVSWWGTSCCLGWDLREAGKPWFGNWVGFWLGPKPFSNAIKTKLQKLGMAEVEEDFGISQNWTVEAVSSFDEGLEELLLLWIRMWTKIGGIKGGLS